MTRLAVALILVLVSTPLGAQWLKHPTPGIPRNGDGTPNLTAPAPRMSDGKPDLSGIWRINPGAYNGNLLADWKPEEIPAWADALYKQRMEDLGKDDPATFQCLPQGPRAIIGGGWAKVIQTPGLIAILYEDLAYRQIFLDGRELPKDPHPSFMGYSVGRWEGDTLVVESIGFKDRSWLDFGGHPHSEALKITERFVRRDFGHIDLQETFHDPQVYARPWTIDLHADLVTDTELLEYVCHENEKDYQHLVGKASDEKKNAVKVAPEILAKYVGAYEFRAPEDPTFVMILNVTHSGEELFIDVAGKDKQAMISLSDTLFAAVGGRVEFIIDARGAATDMVFHAVEGPMKAKRKPDTSGEKK
jgi:hypothetical protein